jgi:TRAP-type mannitol/chloroaromatic compound transport system substrate-binding protein
MSRICQSLAVVAAAGLGVQLAAPAAAQDEPIRWTMQTAWTPAIYMQSTAESLARRIEAMAGGRLLIEVVPAGAIVPAFETLDATHDGVLDAAHAAASYWTGKHPAFGVFSSTPGGPWGMDTQDLLGWFYHEGGLERYNQLFQDELGMDVVVFPTQMSNVQPLGWFRQPVESWEDFLGITFRAPGMPAEVFSEAGASVVTLPGGEIVPAMERGMLDAAEFNDPTSDRQMGFYDIAPYYYFPGTHESAYFADLMINMDRWNELPDDLKAIIENAAMAEALHSGTRMNIENQRDLAALESEHGVNTLRSPPRILIETLRGWDRLAARYAAENEFFALVLEETREYAERVVGFRWLMNYPAKQAEFVHYYPELWQEYRDHFDWDAAVADD